MIPKTRELILEVVNIYGPFNKVLEIGSWVDADRFKTEELYGANEFVGVDLIKGNNVTLQLNGHDILTKYPLGYFDLVTTFDTLEHDGKFWLTVEGMKAVCRKDGLMMIGVPGINCPFHRHPVDCYRFMEDSIPVMFEGFEILINRNLENGGELQAVGKKL